MNKRIRYIKASDDVMVGSKFYRNSNGQEFRVSFSAANNKSYVGNILLNDCIIKTVQGTSPHKIKIAIKNALVGLGCEFEKETRAVHNED